MLPYDYNRCDGRSAQSRSWNLGEIYDGPQSALCGECVDCQRRTAPRRAERQPYMAPPPLMHRRCLERIAPDAPEEVGNG